VFSDLEITSVRESGKGTQWSKLGLKYFLRALSRGILTHLAEHGVKGAVDVHSLLVLLTPTLVRQSELNPANCPCRVEGEEELPSIASSMKNSRALKLDLQPSYAVRSIGLGLSSTASSSSGKPHVLSPSPLIN